MGDNLRGFLEIERLDASYEPVEKRVEHFNEFTQIPDEKQLQNQAARCMACGVPFCHSGCPVNNQIPDWNSLVNEGDWRLALQDLHITNNFPEFTGRICPAPCESACTLNLTDEPVTIKNIELAIVEKGFENGWIKPSAPKKESGYKVAIIGSGAAGLAAAQDLRRIGHHIEVFEKNNQAGGLLRYGIPDFKLEKKIVERRIDQMRQEGIIFTFNTDVGIDIELGELQKNYDAILLACGIEQPREIEVLGRNLQGIHFAMDYLVQQNKKCADEVIRADEIDAKDKNVIVIGGGDTGSDCIGTANRQQAKSITQFIIQPCPPIRENKLMEWPYWPVKLRTSFSHEEGVEREYTIATLGFDGAQNGWVKQVRCALVDEKRQKLPKTDFILPAELVLIAIGYARPVFTGLLEKSDIRLDDRGKVEANDEDFQTSSRGIFSAGDMRRGQSLTVWAIAEGKKAALAIDRYLRQNN